MAKIMGNTTATAIMVDDKLSLCSKNPIQNKVVAQGLNKKMEFKGDVWENSLPTENNVKGDVHRLYEKDNISTTEKYLLSSEYIHLVWNKVEPDGVIEFISEGYGFKLGADFLTEYENLSDIQYCEIPVNIYDTSYNKIGTCGLFYEPEMYLWVVKNSTVQLTENETYYIERADGKTPANLEPTIIEEFDKIIKGYAIYNGESFDKFYTQESVDKKVAEVEEDYKKEIIQATGLKPIKKVTLEEDVAEVKFTFDKPLSEIVFLFDGMFHTNGTNKVLYLKSSDGWCMLGKSTSVSTMNRVYFSHAKELGDRLWENRCLNSFVADFSGDTTSTLACFTAMSKRSADVQRYIPDLSFSIQDKSINIKAGTTIEIWGREEDENI